MTILGISGFYHDSAAALIRDGKVVCAVQEERFSRIKNDRSFPVKSIRFCLEEGGVKPGELDAAVFYDNPFLTLDRFLNSCIRIGERADELIAQRYEAMFRDRMWIHRRVKQELIKYGQDPKFLVCEHHLSHAAGAFYQSGFEEAAILVIDGVGEWASTTLAYGDASGISPLFQIDYPHSIGLLYSAFTYFCGFRVNSGEYKLMGLAPYGKPVYADLIREKLVDIRPDGSFHLNMEYFEFQYGKVMTGEAFEKLFGVKRRTPKEEFDRIYLDLAASIQEVTEEIILKTAAHLKQITGARKLCMSGGVALNCVANGKLVRSGLYDDFFAQPAAGDAGGSIGAALYAWHQFPENRKDAAGEKAENGSRVFLGPHYNNAQIREELDHCKAVWHCESSREELLKKTARLLADGKVVGLFQGAMEFGPRALGHRSILADPRRPEMQSILNQKIKFRESFRPFAPAVLWEKASEYFEIDRQSPYMLITFPVRKSIRKETDDRMNGNIYDTVRQVRSSIPAVTHVDYSARVQTVTEEQDPFFHSLIREFERITGCPVLVNTSFNVRGEPIVCTPHDAYSCFMRTGMDVLVIGSYLLYKEEQQNDGRWKEKFVPD